MEMRVRDVMTPDPKVVGMGDPIIEAAQMIIEKRYSGLPVTDPEGTVVGVVEVQDLLPHPSNVPFTHVPVLKFQGEWVDQDKLESFYQQLREGTVEQVMRTDLPAIDADAPLGDAIEALIQQGHRRLLAIDEGKLLGVVTRTDLLRILLEGA